MSPCIQLIFLGDRSRGVEVAGRTLGSGTATCREGGGWLHDPGGIKARTSTSTGTSGSGAMTIAEITIDVVAASRRRRLNAATARSWGEGGALVEAGD